MSRSQTITKAIARINEKYALTEVAEEHGAVLTLRRTADLAITTAGTTITWQAAIRNFQFTWATTTITIPADGWYLISIGGQTLVNINDLLVSIQVGGVNVIQSAGFIGDVDRNRFHATFMRYFLANDAVTIVLTPSANTDIVARAENIAGESPILNIVQISGAVNV